MKCTDIQYDLPDFLQGKLSETQQVAIREHLVSCEQCRSEAEQLKEIFSELHHEKAWTPSETYWATLLPRIHQRIEKKSFRTIPEWIPRFAMPLSAAIVLVIVLVTLNPLNIGNRSDELQAILQQLQPDEIQEIIEMQTSSGILESPSIAEEDVMGLSNGNGSLVELLRDELQVYSIQGVDIESIVRELEEEEISDLVSKLEQRSLIN